MNPSSSKRECAEFTIGGDGTQPTAPGGNEFAAPLAALLLRSVAWTGAARAISAFGYMARYVVFARMLTPVDFGVTGAALFTLRMLLAMTGTGFGSALVKQKEEIDSYLDTVWATEVVRGVLLATFLVGAARPLARFFREEDAYLVFCAVAPLALVRACQSPAMASLYRRMEFHIALILNSSELAASFAIGLIAIVYWRDWRGLVAATFAGQAIRVVLTYWYFPYRPRMGFQLSQAKRMFEFGRWITGTQIAEFAALELDNLVVAHVLGPRALGEYQMAFRLGEMPACELAESFSIVSFPLVSRLAGQQKVCDRLFGYISFALVLFGGIYAGVLFERGSVLVRAGLGAGWLGAVAPLRLLCLYGLFAGILSVGKSFLDGLGTPVSSLLMAVLRSATLAALIYPFTVWYGASGAALAALFSVVLPLPLMLALYRRARWIGGPDTGGKECGSTRVRPSHYSSQSDCSRHAVVG